VIYFIRNVTTGHIKVGFTDDPQKSLRELQAGSSDKFELMKTIEGDEAAEAALHEEFAAVEVDGKWFKPAVHLIEYIARSTLFAPKKNR
jgi:hypothetical protein